MISTVASLKNHRDIFSTPLVIDDHFLALQLVKLSSLHDDQWPDEAVQQFHSIELVKRDGDNALPMSP
jgi:hypothetical protein